MPANEYKFVTRWRLRGTASEIYDLIADPLDYPRWWPSVYLQTKQVAPPDENGLGRRVLLQTKGWLPYTLRWESSTTEAARPYGIAMRATGDFNGRGIWTFDQENDFVDVRFDWQLTADKPLLRYLSFLLKPVFSANHVWAMARGKQSLELELARRHAPNAEARSHIPPPPGPDKTSGLWLALATFATSAILMVLIRLVIAELRAR